MLKQSWQDEPGRTHRALLSHRIHDLGPLPDDHALADSIRVHAVGDLRDAGTTQALLAAMLYWPAYKLDPPRQIESVPRWLLRAFLSWMTPPYSEISAFQATGDADRHYEFFRDWLRDLRDYLVAHRADPLAHHIASFFAEDHCTVPVLFSFAPNLRDVFEARAEIVEMALKEIGAQLEFTFQPRSERSDRRIRVGILKDAFIPHTESYAVLPVFEHLDRTRFDVILYAIYATGKNFERYCRDHADRFVALPADWKECVTSIRADDLDILWIANNVTGAQSPAMVLAAHRLARAQITSIAAPVTMGFGSMDYYLAGELSLPRTDPQSHYREKLLSVPGSGICFNFPLENAFVAPAADSPADRQQIVFASGANYFKIIPELQECWAKLLARVPGSRLMLYPFNPNWSGNYPAARFAERMRGVFARHGVELSRLDVLEPVADRRAVIGRLMAADIYLDSWPYGGATSLIDPLTAGLPIVAREGDALRFRQAPALLREIGLPEFVTKTEEEYLDLATALAAKSELRSQFRERILAAMRANPPFLDGRRFGQTIGCMFERIAGES
jgi:predicted O-linked N-acetylglucosamine transferase (SPINDLY family)